MAARVESAAPSLPVVDASQWQGLSAPDREWTAKDWIPLLSTTYLTGPGSVGKSLMTQQLLTCIARGSPFMGLAVRSAISLYVTAEDDLDELHRRQEAINDRLGCSMQDLAGRLFLLSLKGSPDTALATIDTDRRLRIEPLYRQLLETIDAHAIGAMAFDNASHGLNGDENSRHAVAKFLGLMDSLSMAMDGPMILIGHPNKAGAEFSGSTAWENQVRNRLFLSFPDSLEGPIDPNLRSLSRSKSNYAARGEAITFRWLEGAFVRDEDLPENKRDDLVAIAQASIDNELFLACLTERKRQQRAVSELSGRNFAPLVFSEMPESKNIGRRRLEQAMDRLFRLGKIERSELWRGADRKPVFGLRETCGKPAGNPSTDLASDTKNPAEISQKSGAGNAAGNTLREMRETVSKTAEILAGNVRETAGNTHPLSTKEGEAPLEALSPLFDPDHPDSPDTVPGWADGT
ncbi:AAA family ATPase [Sphingobium phenoxybenzoativorans]|uniref:AAA family ATPase n=1 Tax=Sphingobium phenoxybenzoativorans TaxID=1592790 RepID=UPI000872F960|nr:AAA family ATPase [Sphingobium phenoxybenzoativorans]